MPTLKVLLNPNVHDALRILAERELRDPRAQATLIIRRELERIGLLSTAPLTAPAPVPPATPRGAAEKEGERAAPTA